MTPEEPIVLDDASEIQKKDLQELKNDALPEEGWVNCDECQSWVHQICALFNGRTNKSTATYTCPKCYLQKTAFGNLPLNTTCKGAKDLPKSQMSHAIESGLLATLETEYTARASELGISPDEVEKAEGLCVRVLSNVDKKQFVGDEVRRHTLAMVRIRVTNLYFVPATDDPVLFVERLPHRISCKI
jgi:E1A/CREB-binding protein